jgi:hypothetical protein
VGAEAAANACCDSSAAMKVAAAHRIQDVTK